MNTAIVAQVVWLIVGILTCVFAVMRLVHADRGACPILALVAVLALVELGASPRARAEGKAPKLATSGSKLAAIKGGRA